MLVRLQARAETLAELQTELARSKLVLGAGLPRQNIMGVVVTRYRGGLGDIVCHEDIARARLRYATGPVESLGT